MSVIKVKNNGKWETIPIIGSTSGSGVGKVDSNSDGTGEIFNDYENNSALGAYSHVEGSNNVSYQTNSHAEGNNGIAFGNAAHVEGLGTVKSYNINITSIDARNVINYTTEGNVIVCYPDNILRFNNNTRLYTVKDSTTTERKITLDTTTGLTTGNTTVYVYRHYAKGPGSHVEGHNNITTVGYAHVEGSNNTTTGSASHVEGSRNTVNGKYAHAEGYKNTAEGEASHVEGTSNSSLGMNSHAEGNNTAASGDYTHSEGKNTAAIGVAAHSEGRADLTVEVPFFLRTRKLKICSNNSYYVGYIPDSTESQFVLSAGELFKCNGIMYKVTRVDHVGRLFSTSPNIADNIEISTSYVTPTEITIEPVTKLGSAIGNSSHHEGTNNCAYGANSHVGGNGCQAIGDNSFAHGENLIAGDGQTVFGKYNLYNEDHLFQIGYGNDSYKGRANALSVNNDGVTTASRIETWNITVFNRLISSGDIIIGTSRNSVTSAAKGLIITDRGYNTITNNGDSGDTTYLIIGESNKVSGRGFIVVGEHNDASRTFSNNSICVGLYNTICDSQSIAVGYNCTAYGNATVAFGGGGIVLDIGSKDATSLLQLYESTYSQQDDSIHVAFAKQSMVTGKNNLALGLQSMSNGQGNVAKNDQEFVVGSFNDYSSDTNNLFVVGNGTSHTSRGNAFKVLFNGQTYADGAYSSSGADYAEFFEWQDSNTNNEDRVGLFVSLDGDKIVKANPSSSYVLGVVSGNPTIIGDNPMRWKNKYLTDEWGRPIYEDVEVKYTETEVDENGETSRVEKTRIDHVMKINPEWDSSLEYKSREVRPEWSAIGMMGKLLVRQDGTLNAGEFCYPNADGIATKSESGYYVMKVINENQALILFK